MQITAFFIVWNYYLHHKSCMVVHIDVKLLEYHYLCTDWVYKFIIIFCFPLFFETKTNYFENIQSFINFSQWCRVELMKFQKTKSYFWWHLGNSLYRHARKLQLLSSYLEFPFRGKPYKNFKDTNYATFLIQKTLRAYKIMKI